jgi:hypothetical protein
MNQLLAFSAHRESSASELSHRRGSSSDMLSFSTVLLEAYNVLSSLASATVHHGPARQQ